MILHRRREEKEEREVDRDEEWRMENEKRLSKAVLACLGNSQSNSQSLGASSHSGRSPSRSIHTCE